MSLLDDLRPASFRGVPFQVESNTLSAGRRTQIHEYPKKDKPWPEDNGRATREIGFSAFLVGKDYIKQANSLIDALEKEGAGELIHPWFGSMQVVLKEPAQVTFNSAFGLATVALSFVEAGDLEFPSSATSTQAQSRQAADDLTSSASDSFAEDLALDGQPDFVLSDAMADLQGISASIQESMAPALAAIAYAKNIGSVVSSLVSLASNPLGLAERIGGMLGLAGLIGSGLNIFSTIKGLMGLFDLFSKDPDPPVVQTAARVQSYKNAVATRALVRQVVLAQAVGASSLMPVVVHDDAIAIRDKLCDALDKESLKASDAVYPVLMQARKAVWQDLTERSRDSDRLDTLTPPETLPALVVAYERYEDASREAEIVERNRIRHPGFLPPQPLKVLTR